MALETFVGKRVCGMTAEDLNYTEEEFAKLAENLIDDVTD